MVCYIIDSSVSWPWILGKRNTGTRTSKCRKKGPAQDSASEKDDAHPHFFQGIIGGRNRAKTFSTLLQWANTGGGCLNSHFLVQGH